MVEMVPSQKRSPPPLVNVESSTARHEYFDLLSGRIIESFQKSLPPRILVNLVQADTQLLLRGGNRGSLPKIFRVFDNDFLVAFNVPVEIEHFHPDVSQEMLGQGCFAHLPRACNEGHLGLFSKKSGDFWCKVAHKVFTYDYKNVMTIL